MIGYKDFWVEWKYDYELDKTYCIIHKGKERKTLPFASAVVKRYYLDKYDKEVGRKEALKKVLRVGTFTKEERAGFWESYLNRFPEEKEEQKTEEYKIMLFVTDLAHHRAMQENEVILKHPVEVYKNDRNGNTTLEYTSGFQDIFNQHYDYYYNAVSNFLKTI